MPRCKLRGIVPPRQPPNIHAGMAAWLAAAETKFILNENNRFTVKE